MSALVAAVAVAAARRRTIDGRFGHQGPTRRPLDACADPAVTDGRFHRAGGVSAAGFSKPGLDVSTRLPARSFAEPSAAFLKVREASIRSPRTRSRRRAATIAPCFASPEAFRSPASPSPCR